MFYFINFIINFISLNQELNILLLPVFLKEE